MLKFQTKHLGKTVYRNEAEGEDETLYGDPILIIKYNVAGLNARNITSAIVAQDMSVNFNNTLKLHYILWIFKKSRQREVKFPLLKHAMSLWIENITIGDITLTENHSCMHY